MKTEMSVAYLSEALEWALVCPVTAEDSLSQGERRQREKGKKRERQGSQRKRVKWREREREQARESGLFVLEQADLNMST